MAKISKAKAYRLKQQKSSALAKAAKDPNITNVRGVSAPVPKVTPKQALIPTPSVKPVEPVINKSVKQAEREAKQRERNLIRAQERQAKKQRRQERRQTEREWKQTPDWFIDFWAVMSYWGPVGYYNNSFNYFISAINRFGERKVGNAMRKAFGTGEKLYNEFYENVAPSKVQEYFSNKFIEDLGTNLKDTEYSNEAAWANSEEFDIF